MQLRIPLIPLEGSYVRVFGTSDRGSLFTKRPWVQFVYPSENYSIVMSEKGIICLLDHIRMKAYLVSNSIPTSELCWSGYHCICIAPLPLASRVSETLKKEVCDCLLEFGCGCKGSSTKMFEKRSLRLREGAQPLVPVL